MDIYSFRLLLIILILFLGALWLFLRFRGKQGNNDLRKRDLDNHKIGPLFGDNFDEDDTPFNGNAERNRGQKTPEKEVEGSNKEKKPFFVRLTGKAGDKQSPEQDKNQRPKEEEKMEVISIHLRSRKREGFSGAMLLSMFERYNLIFGKMDVFHRQINVGGEDKHSFSVIDGKQPGTLVPDDLKERNTHSIVFYVILNGNYNPLRAFNEMLDAARNFSASLDGALYDEQGSSISAQNIEYQRDIIREFIRRQRVKEALVKE